MNERKFLAKLETDLGEVRRAIYDAERQLSYLQKLKWLLEGQIAGIREQIVEDAVIEIQGPSDTGDENVKP